MNRSATNNWARGWFMHGQLQSVAPSITALFVNYDAALHQTRHTAAAAAAAATAASLTLIQHIRHAAEL